MKVTQRLLAFTSQLVLAAAGILVGIDAWGQTPVERGRALVEGIAGCGNCHNQRGEGGKPVPTGRFAGGMKFAEEPFDAYAPNITPDPETGIGRWTPQQIARAIREGIRPDGSIIGPPMPMELYRGLADDDLQAIVAYLLTVPPVKNAVPKSVYRIKLPPNYGPPVGRVVAPPKTDLVKYGEYLAGPVGHCIECHTPMVGPHPDYKNRLNAGGRPFKGPWGLAVSRNLTPHETGLKGWSDAQIERAIRDGVRADGSPLMPPMGFSFYKSISADEMRALIAYLRSLKPLPTGG